MLNPRLTVPKWSYEHATAAPAWRMFSTFVRVLRAPSFWRSIRLEHPVVPRRLAIYAIAMLLFSHGVCFVAGTIRAYRYGGFQTRSRWIPGITLWEAAAQSLWPYGLGDSREILLGHWRYWMDVDEYSLASYPHWVLLAWTVITPLAFLALSETFRRARVRYAHLFRAGAYSLSWFPVLLVAHIALGSAGRRLPTAWGLTGGWELLRWLVFLLGLAWFVQFWCVVPRRYLRLPHAAGISLAMLAIGGLASILIVVLVALLDSGF